MPGGITMNTDKQITLCLIRNLCTAMQIIVQVVCIVCTGIGCSGKNDFGIGEILFLWLRRV